TTRCCPRPPMRWNVAIAATGRCKRVCTGSAARSVERVALLWTCSENREPKAESKPLGRYTRHAGDIHDTESLLQCLSSVKLLQHNGPVKLVSFSGDDTQVITVSGNTGAGNE